MKIFIKAMVIGMVWLTCDVEAQWEQTNGPYGAHITRFGQVDGYILAGTDSNGMFRSADGGANWERTNGLPKYPITAFATIGANAFAGTKGGGIFVSTDAGANWTKLNSSPTEFIIAMTASNGGLFASGFSDHVYYSSDLGQTWSERNLGVNDVVASLAADQAGNIFAGGRGGIYRSGNNGVTWQHVYGVGSAYDYAAFNFPEGAVELLEKAVDLTPSNAKYHFDLGRAYGAKAQTSNFAVQMITAPKIKSAFEKAVELDGQMVEARQGLLQYYLIAPGIMGGSVSKAREQAEELVKLDAFQGNLALAAIAEKNDDVTSMEICCSRAATANPKSNQPYNRLGYFYLGKGRHDDAIAQFKKMVLVQPEDANSYDSLGDGYMAKNMIDEAIDSYKKSLERNPKFSPSIYNLARCFEKKDLQADAKRAYQQYLQVDPDGRYAKSVREKLDN